MFSSAPHIDRHFDYYTISIDYTNSVHKNVKHSKWVVRLESKLTPVADVECNQRTALLIIVGKL